MSVEKILKGPRWSELESELKVVNTTMHEERHRKANMAEVLGWMQADIMSRYDLDSEVFYECYKIVNNPCFDVENGTKYCKTPALWGMGVCCEYQSMMPDGTNKYRCRRFE